MVMVSRRPKSLTMELSTSVLALMLAICSVIDQPMGALASQDEPKVLLPGGSSDLESIRRLVQRAELNRDTTRSVLVDSLLQLTQLNLSHCSEAFFRSLVAMRREQSSAPQLARFLTDTIKRQRKWCEDYLDRETRLRIGEFSEEARHYFELFTSHDRIGQDFYLTTDSSIGKLRQVSKAEGVDTRRQFQARFGRGLFSACREINQLLDPLEPVRRDHEIFARLPLSCDHHFRINSFCKNLVDFDLLEAIDEILIFDVKLRSDIIKFGRYLLDDVPFAANNQPVASGAALAYAVDYEYLTRKKPDSDRARPLDKLQLKKVSNVMVDLQSTCQTSLELLDNLVWLLDFAGWDANQLVSSALSYDPDGAALRQSRLHKYLRTIRACQQLSSLNVDSLLQRHQQQLNLARQHKARLQGGILSRLGTKMGRFTTPRSPLV